MEEIMVRKEKGEVKYGSLRLKEDTIAFLRNLKDAFEICYGHPFTYDGFIRQLSASLEAGDPAVWEMYCLRDMQRDEAVRKAAELKTKKESDL